MAIPTVFGIGAYSFGTGALTVPVPTGTVAGMMLFLIIESNAGEAVAVSGWTASADSPVNNANGTRLSVFWRRATGSGDDATVTDSGDHQSARIIALNGVVSSGSPIDVTASSTGDTTAISLTGDTSTVNDCLILACVSQALTGGSPANAFSGWTNAALSSVTEQFDDATSVGSGGGIACATGGLATAGVFGATTATGNVDFAWAGIVIAVKPGTPLNTDTDITPTAACGFECGQLGSVGQHWTTVTESSISTTTVRTGARSLRYNVSATESSVTSVVTGSTINVGRFYIRFATLPSADCYIAWRSSAAARLGVAFKQSDSSLYCATASTPSMGASGVAVTTGVWYRVDFRLDGTIGAKVAEAMVDGVALAQATSADATDISAGGLIAFGARGNNTTGEWFYDDFAAGVTSADYPYGEGYVNHFVPVADGVHSTGAAGNFIVGATGGANITDATTDSYTLIDEVPLDDTTPDANDWINNQASDVVRYVEHVFGPASGVTTPVVGPRGVEVIIGRANSSATDGNVTFKINDNGTEATIFAFSGTGTTTTIYNRAHWADPPSAASLWTVVSGNGNFNNLRLRFGYSTDAAPDQYLVCAMVEAEFSGEAPEDTPDTPPDEVDPTETLGIDTWQFDTPEQIAADRDPISYYLVWQMMDNGGESQNKLIEAIRVTGKGKDISVQIHAASPGQTINKDNIETGTSPRATVFFDDSTEVTRHEQVPVKIKNLSIWTARYSGTDDQQDEDEDGNVVRDRLDELIIEGRQHGTDK